MDQPIHPIAQNGDGGPRQPKGIFVASWRFFHRCRFEWEVEFNSAIPKQGCPKRSAASLQDDRLIARYPLLMPQDEGSSQRRMTAQIDFTARRKPSKDHPSLFRINKSGFRLIHLHRQRLHPRIGSRMIQKADDSGVATEWALRECIDKE
jgi:hypothetical protein